MTSPVEKPYQLPVADLASIRTIMSCELLCVRSDVDVATVVNLIIGHHVGCLPVVDERRHPIGIVTKFDLVEQLDAAMQLARGGRPLPSVLAAKTAGDVMMPFALTLDEHATIAHATAMMSTEDTHHVLVVSEDGTLVGVISAKDIVRWVNEQDVLAVCGDAGCGAPVWHPLEGHPETRHRRRRRGHGQSRARHGLEGADCCDFVLCDGMGTARIDRERATTDIVADIIELASKRSMTW